MPQRQPTTSPVFLDNTSYFFPLFSWQKAFLYHLYWYLNTNCSTYLKKVECDNSEVAAFCCRLDSCCHQSTPNGHLGTVLTATVNRQSKQNSTAYQCVNLIHTYNTVKLRKVNALILPKTDNSKIRLPRSKTNSLSTRNAVAIAVEIELTPYGCLAFVL